MVRAATEAYTQLPSPDSTPSEGGHSARILLDAFRAEVESIDPEDLKEVRGKLGTDEEILEPELLEVLSIMATQLGLEYQPSQVESFNVWFSESGGQFFNGPFIAASKGCLALFWDKMVYQFPPEEPIMGADWWLSVLPSADRPLEVGTGEVAWSPALFDMPFRVRFKKGTPMASLRGVATAGRLAAFLEEGMAPRENLRDRPGQVISVTGAEEFAKKNGTGTYLVGQCESQGDTFAAYLPDELATEALPFSLKVSEDGTSIDVTTTLGTTYSMTLPTGGGMSFLRLKDLTSRREVDEAGEGEVAGDGSYPVVGVEWDEVSEEMKTKHKLKDHWNLVLRMPDGKSAIVGTNSSLEKAIAAIVQRGEDPTTVFTAETPGVLWVDDRQTTSNGVRVACRLLLHPSKQPKTKLGAKVGSKPSPVKRVGTAPGGGAPTFAPGAGGVPF